MDKFVVRTPREVRPLGAPKPERRMRQVRLQECGKVVGPHFNSHVPYSHPTLQSDMRALRHIKADLERFHEVCASYVMARNCQTALTQEQNHILIAGELQNLEEHYISLEILQETMIGKLVNKVKKHDAYPEAVRTAAASLVARWEKTAIDAFKRRKARTAQKGTKSPGVVGRMSGINTAPARIASGSGVPKTKRRTPMTPDRFKRQIVSRTEIPARTPPPPLRLQPVE